MENFPVSLGGGFGVHHVPVFGDRGVVECRINRHPRWLFIPHAWASAQAKINSSSVLLISLPMRDSLPGATGGHEPFIEPAAAVRLEMAMSVAIASCPGK